MEEDKKIKLKDGLLLVLMLTVCMTFLANLSIAKAMAQPHFETTSTMWILSNGKLQLNVNKTTGWVTSFQYNGFEILPNDMGIGGDKWQITFRFDNGTFRNFYGYDSISYALDTASVNITLNVPCDWYAGSKEVNGTYGNITYALFSDRLIYEPHIYFNFSGDSGSVGNYTWHNFIATNYADWDSLILYGGAGAYASVSQYNSTTAPILTYMWGYQYIGNNNSACTWGRPMSFPDIVFIKSNLAMSFYLKNISDTAFWTTNDYAYGHVYRTEFGKGFESQTPIEYEFNTSYTFKFFSLTSTDSWTVAPIDYMNNFVQAWNGMSIQTIDQDINKRNQVDIWPSQWYNTTFLDVMRNMSATTLWLYGWQDVYEKYPIDSNWTTVADSLPINATYMRNTVKYLQAEGFKVYMYIRSVVDFNDTSPSDYGMLSKYNYSSYWWAWPLPADHKSVKLAMSNVSAQNFLIDIAKNITSYYEPDGIALDCGAEGSQLIDIMDWGQGDYYVGLMNATYQIYLQNITILGNVGPSPLSLWCKGVLFESPGYNSFEHIELLTSHLYNVTAWLLTTAIRPLDQTVENESMWTRFAISAGINRAFDYSAASLNNETLQSYVKEKYAILWSYIGSSMLPTYKTLYPQNNNFLLGNNTFAVYYSQRDSLWIILFNNQTNSVINIPLYQNSTFISVQSYFQNFEISDVNIITTYSVNQTNWPLYDLYFRTGIPLTIPILPVEFIFGMIGLGSMVIGPMYGAWKIRKKEYQEGMITAVVITILGLALFIAWLWGSA